MVIDPKGLLQGDRIRACSDDAQLHFPRLLAASNTCGRFHMAGDWLQNEVYGSFKVKPSKQQLTAWLREYYENFLLFVYKAPDGTTWAQWDIPKRNQSSYPLAADRRTPAPAPGAFEAFRNAYLEKVRTRNTSHADEMADAFSDLPHVSEAFQKVSETLEGLENPPETPASLAESAGGSGDLPNISSGIGIGVGIGVGVGVGVGEIHPPSLPRTSITDDDAELVYLAYPRKVGKLDAIKAIRKAVERMGTGKDAPRMSPPEALEFLLKRTQTFARSPAAKGEFTPHPATWFNQGRYLDDDNEWNRSSSASAQPHQPTRVSPAVQRQRDSHEAIRAAAARRYGIDLAPADGGDAGEVFQPGATRGNAGYVPGGVGGDDAAVWAGGVPGRVIEGYQGEPVLS